jgi:hypothetical protein
MESPNDHVYWVYARSWGFHVFIFSAPPLAAGFYLSHGIPNDHLRWVCSRSWGFHGAKEVNCFLGYNHPNM